MSHSFTILLEPFLTRSMIPEDEVLFTKRLGFAYLLGQLVSKRMKHSLSACT